MNVDLYTKGENLKAFKKCRHLHVGVQFTKPYSRNARRAAHRWKLNRTLHKVKNWLFGLNRFSWNKLNVDLFILNGKISKAFIERRHLHVWSTVNVDLY